MGTPQYGLAQLDLAGNRVNWSSADTTHDTILLEGSHFHDMVPMATLAVSSLCFISFFAILTGVCCVCIGRKRISKYLPWSTVWVPIFGLLGFFGLDITNRVFHELERKYPSEYLGIDIAIGSLGSIADGCLMVYFRNHSPVGAEHAGAFARLAMLLAVVVFSIISAASKGTQIWNLMVQLSPSDGSDSSGDSDESSTPDMNIYQDLDTAASGMLLLFAISFALIAVSYLRYLSKRKELRKRMSFAVTALAAAFLVRNIVKFVFTLIYSQYNEVAALGVQLIYMAFFGLSSVAVFACIVSIAAIQAGEAIAINQTKYGQVSQTPVNEQELTSHRYSMKSDSTVNIYPVPHGYDPYHGHQRGYTPRQ